MVMKHEAAAPEDVNSIRLCINNQWYLLTEGVDYEPQHTLSTFLRDKLGLLGTNVSCDSGECGACTVLINNKAVLSCITLIATLDGCNITTIEGLGNDDVVVKAFAEQCEAGYGTAMQCGYCTPGFIMAAKGLLYENPDPSSAEIRHALSGNLCRCGTYLAIEQAVLKAAAVMKEQKHE